MRSDIFTVALLLFTSTPAFAHPQHIPEGELIARDNDIEQGDIIWTNIAPEDSSVYAESAIEQRDLFKRKGGGGGGGKGGGGSSSSGGKGGSSSSSGSSGSSSSSGRGSSSSTTGGSTKTGSGPAPRFGGGRYYGGGATTPYAAGRTSPLGIPAVFLGVGALTIFPGLWLYGAYSYPYHNPYTFRNHSRNATNTTTALHTRQTDLSGAEETKPVICLCAQYAECGCDDSGNTTVLDELIGDGSYANLNKTLVNVADNGTSTIFINGTLPNGTTASGGTDDASMAGMRIIAQSSGYWVMVALVVATCWMI